MSAKAHYDTYGRMDTSTSPDGAVTNYYYCINNVCTGPPGITLPATRTGLNNSKIAVVNGRWTRETYDGLGRVVRNDRGDSTGTVYSRVDTDYGPCGCSPTGKMSRVSQPYKPGDSEYWTTYTYDALGRTLSVQAADGQSTTHYAYYGNMTVTTDPAGKWKGMITDITGNLTTVLEPDPAAVPSAPDGSTVSACPANPDTGTPIIPTHMLITCYQYDTLKNLTRVDMWRDGNHQKRLFEYSPGTNYLISATNPENSKVTYTRSDDGKVASRSDAKGQLTKYYYDSYNRLTSVQRYPLINYVLSTNPDPCQSENYYYDGAVTDDYDTKASWGKLTAVTFGGPGGNGGVCPPSDGWQGITYEYSYDTSNIPKAARTTGKRMIIQPYGYVGNHDVQS